MSHVHPLGDFCHLWTLVNVSNWGSTTATTRTVVSAVIVEEWIVAVVAFEDSSTSVKPRVATSAAIAVNAYAATTIGSIAATRSVASTAFVA